jgi:hypothetical protein
MVGCAWDQLAKGGAPWCCSVDKGEVSATEAIVQKIKRMDHDPSNLTKVVNADKMKSKPNNLSLAFSRLNFANGYWLPTLMLPGVASRRWWRVNWRLNYGDSARKCLIQRSLQLQLCAKGPCWKSRDLLDQSSRSRMPLVGSGLGKILVLKRKSNE